VYARRRKQNEDIVLVVPTSPLFRPNSTRESPSSYLEYLGNTISLDSPSTHMSSRLTPRPSVGCPPNHYDFSHGIV
jgi:hypothetical protein